MQSDQSDNQSVSQPMFHSRRSSFIIIIAAVVVIIILCVTVSWLAAGRILTGTQRATGDGVMVG